MPLVSKCITIDGSAVANPQNVMAPIGTPVKDIIEFCGGFKDDSASDTYVEKVLLGGPMTGTSIPNMDIPVVKTTNAVLAFLGVKEKTRKRFFSPPKETACIKCGKCAFTCPVFLNPMNIEIAYNLKNREQLKALKVNMCIGCGCCAYSCPAKRPLVQVMQLSNNVLWEYKSKLKSANEEKEAKKST
jgi:electron transport complex protein RnfC